MTEQEFRLQIIIALAAAGTPAGKTKTQVDAFVQDAKAQGLLLETGRK